MSAVDRVTILLLAAGRSTRMRGADKMLEPVPGPFGDQPLLQAMARRCLRAGPTRVVLGPGQDTRRALLEGLDVDVLEAPEGAGMAASIVTGVDGLDTPVLVVLADMPDVTAADLHLMIALSAQAPEAILRAASEDGTPGHPVLFPADLLPELAATDRRYGRAGGADAVRDRVHLVPLKGDRALTDLDTPETWAAGGRAATRKRRRHPLRPGSRLRHRIRKTGKETIAFDNDQCCHLFRMQSLGAVGVETRRVFP
jgi:molybdenum cofactor cytidylyltransferase